MAEKYPDGGKIAILDLPENESCVDRVNGFLTVSATIRISLR